MDSCDVGRMRAPSTPFEVAVFKDLLRRTLDDQAMPRNLLAVVGERLGEGLWAFTLEAPAAGQDLWGRFMAPRVVRGTAWLEEDGHGEPLAMYRLHAQPPHVPFAVTNEIRAGLSAYIDTEEQA